MKNSKTLAWRNALKSLPIVLLVSGCKSVTHVSDFCELYEEVKPTSEEWDILSAQTRRPIENNLITYETICYD